MRRFALIVLIVLTALTAPASALAKDTYKAIYTECQTGKITGTYTQAQYAQALRNIQTDLDEYTDCRDVIRRAQLGGAGGKGSGGGGAGGAASGGGSAGPGAPSAAAPSAGKSTAQLLESASPAEKTAVGEARKRSSAPVVIGGRAVSPATAGRSPAGAANVVPTPLIVALALLALGLALGAAQTIRSRVLARRAAPA